MTRAIILGAGQGRRLLPVTENRPKCLLNVLGKTIIEWQIDALLDAGIKDVTLVTGFQPDEVDSLLLQHYADYPSVTTLFNPFFDVSDNLASCWIAREAMDCDFILLNGDTVFESAVLERALSSPSAPITLTVDHKSTYDEDDMKVELDGERVRHVSKTLLPKQTDAESIGLIYFRDLGPRLFRTAVEDALKHPTGLCSWFLTVIDKLAGEQLVNSCSITGLRWYEIDVATDIAKAESIFANYAETVKSIASRGL